MQICSMDDLLIEIYNIRNIIFIKLYDLVITKSPRLLIIPALLVFYDGGKHINLCSKDKYFSVFVRKVYQVYNDEKNNILEDSLTDPFRMHSIIEIDDNTKKVLESKTLLKINDMYKFYEDKGYYEKSLLLESDEVRAIFPIVKYHIEDMFSKTDAKVKFKKDISGYRSDYCIEASINGVSKQIFINYEKEDNNNYKFILSGLIDNNVPLELIITFLNNGIDVNIKINSFKISNIYQYIISNGIVKIVNTTKKENEVINYINKNLEECQCDLLNLTSLDEEADLKWFLLPWNSYYGIDTKITDLTEMEKNIEIRNMYISAFGDSFIKKEYYSKSYKRNSTTQVNGEVIVLDEVNKSTIGTLLFNNPNIYLIETAFADTVNKSGYYNAFLKDKYFYQIGIAKNVWKLKKETLVDVTQKDEVFNNGDVLNKQLVLKLIGGK